MDSKLLIDAIVRQTTILIAALSTSSGIRAPLAHVADQVFLDLTREIESQGVGRKVVADMFGLALRSYQRKVQRLSESISERNRSLWEAVYRFIIDNRELSRKQIDQRFRHDPPEDLAAVINDLVRNGLVFATGHGRRALYRIVSTTDRKINAEADDGEALANLVWAAVYRRQAVSLVELSQTLGAPKKAVERAVDALIKDGRIRPDKGGKKGGLMATTLHIPVGSKRGWEAAVFDHFSAVAAAIAAKVAKGSGSQEADRIGGATLTFEIYPEHPHADRVYGLLKHIRAEINALWESVENYNRSNPVPEEQKDKVTFYYGQNLESRDDSTDQPRSSV